MGNEESDYGDEYDSEEYDDLPIAEEEGDEYYEEEEEAELEEEEGEEEYEEEEDEEVKELVTKGRRSVKEAATPGETPGNQEQLDMLEKLAQQMKDEKEALKAE